MSETPPLVLVGLGMIILPLLYVLAWTMAEAYDNVGGWRGVLVAAYPLVALGLILWGMWR
jgi:hypothetical protein